MTQNTYPSHPIRTLFALLLTVAALAGCGGGSSISFPTVASTALDDKGPIFRSLAVTLSEPGGVEVRYGAPGTTRLSMESASANATSHQIALPRLRANTTYTYEVRTMVGGQRSPPMASGSFQTGDLPADVQAMTFTTTGSASYPLTFLSVRSTFKGGVVFDSAGQVVWYARTSTAPQGAVRRANGDWVLVADGLSVFSPLGEPLATLAQSRMPPAATIHHGVATTPADTVLFIALDPRVFGPMVLAGEAIWEWNPRDDSVIKRWSAFDFFDPTIDFGTRSIPDDWFHANSVALGPRGNAIVSFHFLDQVISLTPNFSSVEWRLGGPGSTYLITPEQATSGQHSARDLGDNRILIFDNGFARADGSRYSRGLELTLDPVTSRSTTTWQYRPNPDIWATIISSIRRLSNGNSVLTFGTPAGLVGASGPIAVHEVSPAGNLQWQAIVGLPGGSVFQGDPLQSLGGETELD